MKIINLIDLEKSDIRYKVFKFPDGQQNISIDPSYFPKLENIKVEIKSRLNNFQDLELIICATQSLRNLGVKEIHLYTPMFLGSRSDRQFEEGSNNYLKQVICPIINSLNFESVTVLDPHSYVLEACLNNFRKESNFELAHFALNLINKGRYNTRQEFTNKECILISPDAGASHKIYKLAEQMGYKGDIITCSKERDENGKLTKCVVPDKWHFQKDIIIIDDICDGGQTFINIANEIKKTGLHEGKIYLIVTHGIFSKGYNELNKYFDGIYCTNSYKDIPELEWDGDKKDIKTNVKQLNVF